MYRMRGAIALTLLLCFIAAYALSACGPADPEPSPTVEDEVIVLGAASVEPALRLLEEELQGRGAGLELASEFGGTATILAQVNSGRPFDVIITASRQHMVELSEEGQVSGDPFPLATNRLALVVPADNPGDVDSYDDFIAHAEDLSTAVCAAEVPCGHLAETLQDELRVDLHADTKETSVASVMTKVTMGEVDAGFVYVTDADAAGDDVEVFEIPEFPDNDTQIWAAMSAEPEHTEAAEQLLTLMMGEVGRSAFEEAGFLPPPAAEASNGG